MKNINILTNDYSEPLTHILHAAEVSENEEQLKFTLENILMNLCKENDIFWNPYTYEHTFKSELGIRSLDAVHGATIIEYEPPRSFKKKANHQFRHACSQAEEYAGLLSVEEGRPVENYILVVWDGETISFGKRAVNEFVWENPSEISTTSLSRLLLSIKNAGRPLVSPFLLKQNVGPETEIGKALLPLLFKSIVSAVNNSLSTRTKLIYTEWARLFGQVDGTETERLKVYLKKASKAHEIDYSANPQAYVFALNTYIALIAKICSTFALLKEKDIADFITENPKDFLKNVENGGYFTNAGIINMLSSDFFSWYLGDDVSENIDGPLAKLLEAVKSFDFDLHNKSSNSIRDLFKGLYMEFTPGPMRHALGEYYTPDWLASHVLDKAQWNICQSVLDPTCGSGTFVLEAIKRKLENSERFCSAKELLRGVYGCDLNPLAVLTAKASLVVFLADFFDEKSPTELPIYLADAINTADPSNGFFEHTILTEKGNKSFVIPEALALSSEFYDVMDSLRVFIDSELDSETIFNALNLNFQAVSKLQGSAEEVFKKTIIELVDLHKNQWNGIWCLILFDRIKAGCIKNVDLVVGNPPWVKWSNLPASYAEFIKPLCNRLDIFSDDAWVGGIQSDISTVVTYHALERFVRPGGKLAFLITGTVFKNESSQGFRRWQLFTKNGIEKMSVELVEDYDSVRPFEGVANFPTLLVIDKNNQSTSYPVQYIKYDKSTNGSFLGKANELLAIPVPGTEDGPWMVGNKSDISLWPSLFNSENDGIYKARKGVTTDANGIYFVDFFDTGTAVKKHVKIKNDPKNGRNPSITSKTTVIEDDHVYPLLRGRDIKRFRAKPANGKGILVPQKGMFGDENLPIVAPKTFKFLASFRSILENRSSYKRFQKGKPFWSLWSTGEYSFAPFKVVWKEMSGSKFVAAYIGDGDFLETKKVIIPDHKVYFIPVSSEDEAAYLTSFLNSRVISKAISSYSSALSLGTSVAEYINIPEYEKDNEIIQRLSQLGKKFTKESLPTSDDEDELDSLVLQLLTS